MIMYFCKALDRPIDIFGLKGKWITVFLCGGGACVLLAFIVGFIMTAGTGICVAIVGSVVSFVLCYAMQGKTSHRDLQKIPITAKAKGYVKRRETLCRIVYEYKDEPSWFAAAQQRRDDEKYKRESDERQDF